MSVRGTHLYGDSWAQGVATRQTPIGVAVLVGQSNARGASTYTGVSGEDLATVHPTLTPTFYDAGVEVTTYDATEVGPLPRLIELMGAEDSSPVVIRRAVSASPESSMRLTQLPGVLTDLAALELTPEDVGLVWLVHGESPSLVEDQAVDYAADKLERNVRICESLFEHALVAISLLRSDDDYGAYYATIRDAQRVVAARRGSRRLVDTLLPTPIELEAASVVHYSSGTGGGYDDVVDRLWAALGAS